MAKRNYIWILLLCVSLLGKAQSWIEVENIDFNLAETKEFDETSPVPYNNGLLFAWNKKVKVIRSDITEEETPLFDIYFSAHTSDDKWTEPTIFSEDITTRFHEGPLALDPNGREIYFTQNINRSLKEDNVLGLYRATISRNGITNSRPFAFNNENYNIAFPNLSPDGSMLFFASDMPGGEGGYDIYVCTKNRSRWNEPVNLGPVINTRGDEISPFAHISGRLYFSSNGHDGIGRRDIFYSEKFNDEWMAPENLGEPINSRRDDYSIFIDDSLKNGYFTSTRNRTHDIFFFKSTIPEFNACNQMEENSYCYRFKEENTLSAEMGTLGYEWDFGDGTKSRGLSVRHCFPGPGSYLVQLNVIDSLTGDVYFSEASYDLVVEDIEQAYVSSPDTAFVGETIEFSGTESYSKTFKPDEYVWDFGDLNHAIGETTTHVYKKPGFYTITLGIMSPEEKNQSRKKLCSYKMITILPKNVTSSTNMQ